MWYWKPGLKVQVRIPYPNHYSLRTTISTLTRGVRRIFFRGGKVIFPDFFPSVKCFFPVENSHFGRSKTNLSGFEKWKANFKKKVLSIFCNFYSFHFKFYTFPFFNFPSFLLHFPFPLCLSFPGRSAEISLWEVSGGHCLPAVCRFFFWCLDIQLLKDGSFWGHNSQQAAEISTFTELWRKVLNIAELS